MLYLSTRNKQELFTAHRALTEEYANDGGLYIPFRLPVASEQDILTLCTKPFPKIVADILNVFFSARLTAMDVEFCFGKSPISATTLNHKVIVTEIWRNPAGSLDYFAKRIFARLLDVSVDVAPVGWAKMAIMIALIHGIYSHLVSKGLVKAGDKVDFSVPSDEYFWPTAVWYCKKMGLPINMIICAGNEKNNIWDMVHRGSLSTATSAPSLLLGLERTILAIHGASQLEQFINCCDRNRTYHVPEEMKNLYSNDFFCAVAGTESVDAAISSVYRSTSYVIDPVAALCFRGIQDYRASTGTGSLTVIISENKPNE